MSEEQRKPATDTQLGRLRRSRFVEDLGEPFHHQLLHLLGNQPERTQFFAGGSPANRALDDLADEVSAEKFVPDAQGAKVRFGPGISRVPFLEWITGDRARLTKRCT